MTKKGKFEVSHSTSKLFSNIKNLLVGAALPILFWSYNPSYRDNIVNFFKIPKTFRELFYASILVPVLGIIFLFIFDHIFKRARIENDIRNIDTNRTLKYSFKNKGKMGHPSFEGLDTYIRVKFVALPTFILFLIKITKPKLIIYSAPKLLILKTYDEDKKNKSYIKTNDKGSLVVNLSKKINSRNVVDENIDIPFFIDPTGEGGTCKICEEFGKNKFQQIFFNCLIDVSNKHVEIIVGKK
ncbi:MAG: hypothetical protein ABF750_08155 [Oenococcus oeni]